MDSNRRERQLARPSLNTRSLARPARFEPEQLVDSGLRPRDEHAREYIEAMQRARVEGLELARAEVDAAVAEHTAVAQRLALLARALSAAVDQLNGRDRDDLSDIEDQAVQFGVELAEQLVGRELANADAALTAAVKRAMSLVPHRGSITLRINPLDRDTVDAMMEIGEELTARVDILADASVERGGCVAVVGALNIDAQLGSAMQRVRDVVQP